MVLKGIKNLYDTTNKMPILTIVNRWLKPSKNCYLCPNRFDMQDGNETLVFTMSFVWTAMKPEFIPWINKVSIGNDLWSLK